MAQIVAKSSAIGRKRTLISAVFAVPERPLSGKAEDLLQI